VEDTNHPDSEGDAARRSASWRRHFARTSVRKWLTRTLLGMTAAAVLGLVAYGFLPKPALVEVAPVTRGTLQAFIEEDGRTRVENRFTVFAPVAGFAERIVLRPGDKVASDSSLVRILPLPAPLLDPRTRLEAQARVNAGADARRQAHAATLHAEEAHGLAMRELERIRKLAPPGAVSAAELERAASALRSRQTELLSARYAEQVATHQLEDAMAALGWQDKKGAGGGEPFVVTPPAPGLVLRVVHQSAGPVSPGTPLLEVGDLASLEVVAEVLTRDAVGLRPGMKVELERWGGTRPLPGRVREVEPSAFTKVSPLGTEEQRVNVIVEIDTPVADRPQLGDGYELEARIITWEGQDVVQMPASALFRRGDGWAAFVVQRGRARLRPVTVGHRNALQVEVLAGLSPSEEVILHPGDTVRDGARVAVR
jgi:HlyD family secretion protein